MLDIGWRKKKVEVRKGNERRGEAGAFIQVNDQSGWNRTTLRLFQSYEEEERRGGEESRKQPNCED